ncbi:MAG: PAS domain-containing protein, partial [Spirochaetota bacterium]
MNSPVTHILSLVDTVTHPAAIVNGAAHIIHHNPHFQSLLKDTAEADTAITTEHIPGGEEYWKGRIEESLAGNAVSGILHKTLSWSLVPLLDGGQTYLLLRISRTASGHDDLPVSQATFRKFIDLSRTFILVLDTKGTIVMINETGSRILGRHSDQLIGQNWFTVAVNETDRAKVQHVFTNIVSGQIDAFRHVESEIISLSGARHIIYWHNDAITDADGKIRYIISSGDDITEKRKSQKELLS